MQLYMKQKVFSIKDKFTIQNADGEDVFFVEGKVISLGKKLSIKNAEGAEVAFVKQKVVTLMPKFEVEIDGEQVAVIQKKMGIKPKYVIDGLGWEVKGNFFSHDYVITENGEQIVSIHKKWMAWGDTVELDIADDNKVVIALAVVLAIDAVMDAQESSSSSFSFGSSNN